MNENDILDSCLNALRQGATLASCVEKHPELSEESRAILQAAARLHDAGKRLAPDPAFKRRVRSNLMERIAADQARRAVPARTQPAAPGLLQRWRAFLSGWRGSGLGWQPLAAALAFILIVTLSAGIVSAARGALPGAPLYPVKRLSEQARSILRRDDILWRLELAQHRLDEAVRLASQGDDATMDDALAAYVAILDDVARLLHDPTIFNAVASQAEPRAILLRQLDQLTTLRLQTPSHEATVDRAISAAARVLELLYPNAQPTPASTPAQPIQPAAPSGTPLPPTPSARPSPTLIVMPTAVMPQPTATAAPPTPTMPQPTPTSPPAPTVQPPTATPVMPGPPTATTPPMATPPPTSEPAQTPTHQPPAATMTPPTPTMVPPTATPQPPTPTPQPPAPTMRAPTATSAPPMPPTVTIMPPAP